ncbi:hypothetical protein ACFRMO_08120 [Streptomyces anulatus]|uniref:hypothetical protein n=1 Tax=Streptomyces anulatus TaxID=1892 RepID=UPI00368191E2
MKKASQPHIDVAGPPPAFDAVPGCSGCTSILSIAGFAWKRGWTLIWLDWGTEGDRHLKREHLDDPRLDPDIRALLLNG